MYSIGPQKIRIGLWGPLYYTYNKEPPPPSRQKKREYNSIGNYFGPDIGVVGFKLHGFKFSVWASGL